jgi:hypothetical protein
MTGSGVRKLCDDGNGTALWLKLFAANAATRAAVIVDRGAKRPAHAARITVTVHLMFKPK